MPPIPPSPSAEFADQLRRQAGILHVQPSTRSFIDAVGSISIAERFVKPLTRVASLPNFWEKASERLCAGSVELRRA